MTTTNLNNSMMHFFIGIVNSLEDPLMLGRVKVRILNENDDDVSTDDLRFATPITPINSASLNGVGTSPTGLEIGSFVFGFYLDQKEKNIPMLIGSYNKIPGNDVEKHDVSKLARGINNIDKTLMGPEPASPYAAKYPYNKTMTTKSGHAIEIDDTPGHERINIHHKSGSYTEINEGGRMVRKIVDDDIEITVKDRKIYINGNANIEVQKNMTAIVKGNMTSTVDGNYKISAGGNIDITAAGVTNIKGSKVNLN